MIRAPRPKADPQIARGWVAIAEHIHVGCKETAIAYARLQPDPLPVLMVRGVPHARRQRLDEWCARRNGGVLRDGTTLERAEGIRAIAVALNVCHRTVLRLAHHPVFPLPINGRHEHRWAYITALRDYLDRQTMPFQIADQLRPIKSAR